VTPGAVIVLLGFGLGALVVAGQSSPRGATESSSPRERADALRAKTIQAQQASARASRTARELMAAWSAAEDAARKEERSR